MDGASPSPRASWPTEYAVDGDSIEAIARRHGVSYGAVRAELLARGVAMRPQGSNRTPSGRPRSVTIGARALAIEAKRDPQPPTDVSEYARPVTRGDCLQGEHAQRPCPYASCKHHLYLEVSDRDGAITLRFPDMEVWEMKRSCTLDEVAENPDGMTLDDAGQRLGVTRERARQIEEHALCKSRLTVIRDDER